MNKPIAIWQTDHAACDERRADERLVLLHRAHARLILFENGLMTLDEAVFGLFEEYFPCSRGRERRSM
jgi:hypothetical protein